MASRKKNTKKRRRDEDDALVEKEEGAAPPAAKKRDYPIKSFSSLFEPQQIKHNQMLYRRKREIRHLTKIKEVWNKLLVVQKRLNEGPEHVLSLPDDVFQSEFSESPELWKDLYLNHTIDVFRKSDNPSTLVHKLLQTVTQLIARAFEVPSVRLDLEVMIPALREMISAEELIQKCIDLYWGPVDFENGWMTHEFSHQCYEYLLAPTKKLFCHGLVDFLRTYLSWQEHDDCRVWIEGMESFVKEAPSSSQYRMVNGGFNATKACNAIKARIECAFNWSVSFCKLHTRKCPPACENISFSTNGGSWIRI